MPLNAWSNQNFASIRLLSRFACVWFSLSQPAMDYRCKSSGPRASDGRGRMDLTGYFDLNNNVDAKIATFPSYCRSETALGTSRQDYDGEVNACRFSARTGGPGRRRPVSERLFGQSLWPAAGVAQQGDGGGGAAARR